jgi:hypothetical protein
MDFSALYAEEGEREDEAELYAQSLRDSFLRESAAGYVAPPRCVGCLDLEQTTACLDCRRGYCEACLFEHLTVKRFAAHRKCSVAELAAALVGDEKWREDYARRTLDEAEAKEKARRAEALRRAEESRQNKTVRACVRACMRACVHACMRACMLACVGGCERVRAPVSVSCVLGAWGASAALSNARPSLLSVRP